MLGPTASSDQVGQERDRISNRIGPRGLEFAAADRRLGETDGSDAGGSADLDVGHGVPDKDGLVCGSVKEVKRALNG